MANSYSALGRWFEYLNDDCGYEKWSQYLINALNNHGANGKGVDIGCGNGYFTRALIKSGYPAVGIDISAEMLDTAQRLSLKEGVRTEFLIGDITKLKLNFKAAFAVAVNDCINYVPKEKLKTAFLRVHACLKKGAPFIFDISSAEKLKNTIGSNFFAEDRDELTYIWFNELKDDRVVMDITLFEKTESGAYRRRDERHVQYIHEESEIISALEEVGFSVRSEGHMGGDKRERINFICTRL
ncbi:MAG: class I SAM-dependent methyltransferase [Clostridia bacterium]|nr:class I SAM-dependent methyltransferase [Clostridia bacterium]